MNMEICKCYVNCASDHVVEPNPLVFSVVYQTWIWKICKGYVNCDHVVNPKPFGVFYSVSVMNIEICKCYVNCASDHFVLQCISPLHNKTATILRFLQAIRKIVVRIDWTPVFICSVKDRHQQKIIQLSDGGIHVYCLNSCVRDWQHTMRELYSEPTFFFVFFVFKRSFQICIIVRDLYSCWTSKCQLTLKTPRG